MSLSWYRGLLLPGLATLAGIGLFTSLGVWQVHRLAWKEALIATVESRIHRAPSAAPGPAEWGSLDAEAIQYLPVEARGQFVGEREVHVFATVQEPKGPVGGVGYFVMAPFETDGGFVVIVNRGFVPSDKKDAATRPGGRIEGSAVVTGLARPTETAGAMTPADDTAKNIWFTRDPKKMAGAFGIDPSRVAPYTIDARFDPALPGGLPQGGETVVNFPNNHLGYAVTWFGLALTLGTMFLVVAIRRVRGGDMLRQAPPPSG